MYRNFPIGHRLGFSSPVRLALAGCVFLLTLWCGGVGVASAAFEKTHAWLRTPDSKSPAPTGTAVDLTCLNCTYNSADQLNAWAHKGTGEYVVILRGVAIANNPSVAYHVNAFGKSGVQCTAIKFGTGALGSDYYINVACRDVLGAPVNSRFSLVYTARKGTHSSNFDTGFAEVSNNALLPSGTYTTGSQAPTLTKLAVGSYRFLFAGLSNTRLYDKRGNAQVTSRTTDRRCSLEQWFYPTATSVQVDVRCLQGTATQVDADFQVTFGQIGVIDSDRIGILWSGNKGVFTSYTPDSPWNLAMLGGSDGLMTVTRLALGRYSVDFKAVDNPGLADAAPFMTLVSPWQSTASCTTTSFDSGSAQVDCTSPSGAWVDSGFSFQIGSIPKLPLGAAGFYNIGNNYEAETFDVGHGLMCGMSALETKRLQCSVPHLHGQVRGPLIAAGTAPGALLPTTQRSIAIDNLDMTTTTILALGTDSVLRGISGDLRLAWGPVGAPNGNFQTVRLVANPVMSNGAAVNLRKIVVVRTHSVLGGVPNTRDVLGMTTNNTLVQLGNANWTITSYKLPAGKTLKDISHGPREALYALMTDGSMYVSTKIASTPLPPLPKGLKPVAMGGRFVITNAGVDANGEILCKGPIKNGCYQCAGEWDRFYQYSESGSWVPAFSSDCHQTEENSNIIEEFTPVEWGYNPYAWYAPRIVDARLFSGEPVNGLMFQSFSRLYHGIFGR